MLAIWPQQLAMAQIIPGSAPAPPYGSAPANTTAAGAPANTTRVAAHVTNTTAEAPAGEEVVPHWYGGAPCSHNSCHN